MWPNTEAAGDSHGDSCLHQGTQAGAQCFGGLRDPRLLCCSLRSIAQEQLVGDQQLAGVELHLHTMRFGGTSRVLVKSMLKYRRSLCCCIDQTLSSLNRFRQSHRTWQNGGTMNFASQFLLCIHQGGGTRPTPSLLNNSTASTRCISAGCISASTMI